MKSLKRICIIGAILILVFSIFQSGSFAYDWKNQISNSAGATGDANVTGSVTNIAGSVVTIARVICVGVAITMLVVLAIKYMSSAPGDKATIKKSAVTYVVGAVIMFAASGILGIIQKFANNISA